MAPHGTYDPLNTIDALQKTLQYQFETKALLQEALTHKSYAVKHNERLEFLGDAVLSLVITTALYQHHPKLKEGSLSNMRANLVRKETLARIAEDIQLGQYIKLGKGELASGGRLRPSILANALEALLGAIYLDADLKTVESIILRLFDALLSQNIDIKYAKSDLQEFLQAKGLERPSYTLSKTTGKSHEQCFHISCEICHVGGQQMKTQGRAFSRKQAEQIAAQEMLKKLKKEVGR